MGITYDDTNLRKLFEEMAPKNRKKALKGSFRRTGNYVRGIAVRNLQGTGINHATRLRKGIRTVVFKRDAGFRVTAASRKADKQGKGERGMHTNRYGLKKPVLSWAETGTQLRLVKRRGYTRVKVAGGRFYTVGANRGRMPKYGFMERTRTQVDGSVMPVLRKEICQSIQKIARKYGCK